jgi:prepilin signal peptidase PulO-like enzyme (type II secretory pathway)
MIHLFLIICLGILGIIVGSFLNVVILRMNTGKGLGGRSQCFSCNHTLSWYELIPVVSFLVQQGKCRSCRSKISIQYPLVELVTGILFAITGFFITSGWHLFVWLLLVALGMVIAVYDMKHRMIPVIPLVWFTVIGAFLGFHIFGIIIAAPFLLLWIISSGKWIGFGDIEIIGMIGVLLGWISGFSAIMISFWIASAVMIPIVYLVKKRNIKQNPEIPFGPFLLIGFYLVGVCGLDVLKIIMKMI